MKLRKYLVFAAACAAVAIADFAAAASRQDARLLQATEVLNELQASPDQNVPQWLLERAYAVAIVPDVIKVGLGIGGRRGSGVLVIRRDNGHWSNPVFVNLTGGSFGFQIGVQSTDVMLVFTSRASVEGLVGGKVTLGADASVAAGPVGRSTSAATDVGLTAQVYSYSRAQGLFAGVALEGSAITISHSANAAYYGRPGVLASEIVASTAPVPPDTAQQFTTTLDRILGVAAQSVAQGQRSESPAPSESQTQAAPQPADVDKLTTRPMEDPNPGAEPPE
jgi:lipid-binding SYLF domain-containing protein